MHVDYRPATHVLDHLKNVDLIAVVGPTAAGKTSIIEEAIERYPALHLVPFTTTRAPRPGEQNGIDYHFRSRKQMKERIAKSGYVNVVPQVFGDLYASAPEDYSTAGLAVTAILADTVSTFRTLPLRSCQVIFIVPPSWDTWQRRIKAHGFTPSQLKMRMAEAKKSLGFAQQDKNVKFVINKNFDVATDDFLAIARSEPLSQRLQSDQPLARKIVRNLLARL